MMSDDKENRQIVFREFGISATKGAIGAIPYIGTALNEALFDNRSRIKQERINKFINLLKGYMESISEDEIDFQHLGTEEFSDIFESILNRVVQTRSNEKLKRLKNILVSEIINPSENNFNEIFLDIISRLEETEILILSNIKRASDNCDGLFERVAKYQEEIENLKLDIEREEKRKKSGIANNASNLKITLNKRNRKLPKMLNILIENQKYYSPKTYSISKTLFTLNVQDLISQGLLHERIIQGKINGLDVNRNIEITKFGREFINFIEKNENST